MANATSRTASAGIPLRRLASISDDDVDRERTRRAQGLRILLGYFAGDNCFGACPVPVLGFHRDRRLNRILIGANKSAKTIGGVVDVTPQCAGRHPFRRRLRPPIAARVVAPELPGTMDKAHVQRETFREWVPEAWLRGGSWDEANAVGAHTLHFANGLLALLNACRPEKFKYHAEVTTKQEPVDLSKLSDEDLKALERIRKRLRGERVEPSLQEAH